MKIKIENLDRQNNEAILREYFKHENEWAIDIKDIMVDLNKKDIFIARSTLDLILIKLMKEKFIARKMIGNAYVYFKIDKVKI